MRLTRSGLACTLATLVVSGCIGGAGSGLTGISGGTGGTTRTLSFTVQPSNGTADAIITPAIQIAALDTSGSVDVTFTGAVSMTLITNPTGAFLEGTKTVIAVSGVASFGDLSVDRAGAGYALRATASGAAQATSAGFSVASASP